MGKKQVLRSRKHGDQTIDPLHPALQALGMSIPIHCGTMLQCACLNFKDKSKN